LNDVQVEIWADIACPWCYLGKRRFEAALAAFEHRDEVEVAWRSFELDPSAPPVREIGGAEHLAQKYGMSVDAARARQAQIAQLGAAEDIDFRFDAVRGGNTFDAHRLVHLAREQGKQEEVVERLFRANFTDGVALGDPGALAGVAAELGLPALEGDRFAAAVREEERTAASLGITAVPFYVADRALGASGAQPPEVLLDFLRQARERRAAA
jgi:predicted DsbA family dithiol-disulfide isomerase